MLRVSLLFTTNQKIMDLYGRKSGFSFGKQEKIWIHTPLITDLSRTEHYAEFRLEGNPAEGFRTVPTRIGEERNLITVFTKNSMYVFQTI